MRRLLALAFAASLTVQPAAAQDSSVSGIPPATGRDGLLVSLVHTSDRDAFFRAWLAGETTLPVTDRATRGRSLTAIVIIQGCRAGPGGLCDVDGHFTYLRPDGSVYGEVDAELWSSRPHEDGRALPSPGGPGLVVDPPDPMGIWTLRVRVTDNVRGISVETEARIVVDTPPTAG